MKENSRPICKLAKELGVSENNLNNWRKLLREKSDCAFSNQPSFDKKELEIRRLKARVGEIDSILVKKAPTKRFFVERDDLFKKTS